MCSRVSSCQWASHTRRTSRAVSFPSALGTARTLWPVASMAPVSWTLMWPLAAAMTPWWGRRAAAITVVLVWVPPTRKWTSRASFSHRARILALAWAQYASSP